jgi:DNA-binding NtrC family response regulator
MDAMHHKILIAGKDESSVKSICGIIKAMDIECGCAFSIKSAVEKIKKIPYPFSMVIFDHSGDDNEAMLFFEQAMQLSPNTTRVMLSSAPDINYLINAVNMGMIQKFILKPWEYEDLAKAVHSGIRLYEIFLENQKLTQLAKKQNSSLFELNCQLMETAKAHNRTLRKLEHDIEELKEQIAMICPEPDIDENNLMTMIHNELKKSPGNESDIIEQMFCNVIQKRYSQFQDSARKNGFEMPDIGEKAQ